MQYDVFISYSRKDSEVANRICKAFDEAGITYFIDLQGINGGFEFPTVLAEAIINSKIFLYLASRNSYESKFTQAEITFAFNKKERGNILPYIIDRSDLPLSLEFVFSAINWRRLEEHPINTVLVDDLLHLLGKEKKRHHETLASSSTGNPNEEPMAYWYRKAAEQGDVEAQVNLAYCYYIGSGVEQDYAEAVKWYRKAAEKGSAKAQFSLGACYEFSLGVGQDYTQATKWYRKAAEQGHAEAQGFLGVCYYNALGVARDYHQAAQWYRKAADQGVAEAQKNMGVCYANGHGVAQDYVQAMKWFRMAAEQGNAVAQKYLADCYAMGYREAE